MTQEEWLAHSEIWRDGWNAVAHGDTNRMTWKEFQSLPLEWQDGAMYALSHPFGQWSEPMEDKT